MRKARQANSETKSLPVSVVASASDECRILILAPTGNDARLTADFLIKAGLSAQICREIKELCDEVVRGCGAILLADETLGQSSIMALVHLLQQQSTWSDLPVVLITSGGEANQIHLRRLTIFGPSGNVTLLERPFRPGTLVSVVEVALRARQRQYEVRRLLEVVRESEQRYSQVITNLPAAVYSTDAGGRVTLFNEAALALWGRTPEVGKDLWCGAYKLFRPDGTALPLDDCPMARTLKTGHPVRGEEVLIERPDGTRRNVLPYPDPIRDVSGKLVGAVNMLLDITESRQAESSLQRLGAIVESSEDAIISKDLNGRITSWNDSAERLFGYRGDEVIGKPITILMPADRSNEEPDILARIRRGERIQQYETIRQRKNGSLIEISLTVSPIKDRNGQIVGASKIVRDITRQNETKRELERAHLDVVAASRAKDDFLAALSHELRTPLNPVLLLASEAMLDPLLPAEVRRQFTAIYDNVELEARLIDDLLDLTRIAHGKLSFHLRVVDVRTVLHEAIAKVRSDLDQKRISLTLELAAEQSTVKGDAVRLQQVFWNVLRNAVKFTPVAGTIIISTHTKTDTGELVISIADSGMGMTPDELGGIFEAFVQGDHAHAGKSRHFGGLGLGLAISRMLVEAHSGSISAVSKGREQGSVFSITLPLMIERGAAKPLPDEPSSPGIAVNGCGEAIHILLVEDHEPTRIALANLLTRRHYDVKTAASVAEARELSKNQLFHLLISDIGLPDGSGFELMKELRTGNTHLQGIALTGYGMEEDITHSQQAGFASHLVKPIRVQSLEAALAAVIQA